MTPHSSFVQTDNRGILFPLTSSQRAVLTLYQDWRRLVPSDGYIGASRFYSLRA